MKKFIIAGALGLLLPMAAMAAANVTFLTVDGATNSTVSEGSTVNAKVTYNISASTDVESVSWELVGSGLPQTCVDVPDRITDGTFTASFDIDTTGASEGTWDVRIRAYGDDGSDVSNLCEVTDQVDSQSFTDRITVTDSTNDNQVGGNSGSQPPSWLAALIAAILGHQNPAPTPVPSVSAACVAYSQARAGTQYGVYNNSNIAFQGFLLSQHASIPALAAGASFGFYGPQTMAADTWFQSINHCQ